MKSPPFKTIEQQKKYLSFASVVLPILFLVSALSTGSMAIILSTLGTGLLAYNSNAIQGLLVMEQMLIVIEGLILILFLWGRYRASEQGKDAVLLLISGKLRYLFWQGIIVFGFLLPFVLEWISKYYQSPPLLWVAGLSLLTGGFFLRLTLLRAGIKDQLPMQRLVEVQYGLKRIHPNISTGGRSPWITKSWS